MNSKKARKLRKLLNYKKEDTALLQDQNNILTNPVNNVKKRLKRLYTIKSKMGREEVYEYITGTKKE